MKRKFSPYRPPSDKWSALGEAGLAVLLVVALVQVGICFTTAAHLVPAAQPIYSAGAYPAFQATNGPAIHGPESPRHEKS